MKSLMKYSIAVACAGGLIGAPAMADRYTGLHGSRLFEDQDDLFWLRRSCFVLALHAFKGVG